MDQWRPCGYFKYSSWSYIHGPVSEETSACDKRGHFRMSDMMNTASSVNHPDESVVFLLAGGPFAKTIVKDIWMNPDYGRILG